MTKSGSRSPLRDECGDMRLGQAAAHILDRLVDTVIRQAPDAFNGPDMDFIGTVAVQLRNMDNEPVD